MSWNKENISRFSSIHRVEVQSGSEEILGIRNSGCAQSAQTTRTWFNNTKNIDRPVETASGVDVISMEGDLFLSIQLRNMSLPVKINCTHLPYLPTDLLIYSTQLRRDGLIY